MAMVSMVRTTTSRHLVIPLAIICFSLSARAEWRDGGAAQQTPAPSLRADSQAERAARLVAEGVAALERGDDATARDHLQKALDLNPSNAEAHTYLGVLADRAGDLRAAEQHLARAARLAPASATARNNYGAILMRLGRTREAAAEFEGALRADARHAGALINLAQIRFAEGTPESLRAADQLFARADLITPEIGIARARTVIALRRNDRAAAAAHFRDYATRLAGAGKDLIDAASRAELGAALAEAGLLTEADAELKAAIEADPANAVALVGLARVHLARKDIPGAGRTLEAAVARGVENASVYAQLAEVYERGGHIENAIPAMRLAVARDPQNEAYRFRYGLLLADANAPAAAVIRLEEAVREFPRSARLWSALGIAHYRQGKDDGAATRAFERAIELDPAFAAAYAYLGMMRVDQGQSEEGIAQYERALAADPKLAVVHYLIAEAMLKQPAADAAQVNARLKRAIELDPAFAPARLTLAKAYSRQNRFAEAAAELEGVVKIAPDIAETYYQLGRVYTRLERRQEASRAMEKFAQMSDSQKQQKQNERREIMLRLADVRF
jgi:Tfp pilus assembly protein PilF